ncbi:hypothetical protein MBRU_07540 [Mycolicibacterium brumae DSM 44177]|nr:hypothetical protein MBRU_07540 [Mycolicibacterium brumae DSM 44177]
MAQTSKGATPAGMAPFVVETYSWAGAFLYQPVMNPTS